MNEIKHMTRSLRTLVAWDLEDGFPGYPIPNRVTESTPVQVMPAPISEANALASQAECPDLAELKAELGECTRCKLSGLGRKTIVFGEGNPNADILFAGEGPGFHEDRTGRPFVGPAGELLDRMIGAMGLSRDEVYICNVVKCRPPKNRDPEPDEVISCQPFLRAQVRSVQPKIVVALGRFATQTLLNTTEGIGRLRGQFHPYFGIKLMPTFHPAYLLRNPESKRQVWEDLQSVMAELKLD